MIIDKVFNGINFLVLLVLAVYIFKSYVKPLILDALFHEKKEGEEKKNAYKELEIAAQEIKNKSAEDQIFFLYVQKKIALWQQKRALLLKDKALEKRILQETIHKKNHQKTVYRELSLLQKKALESASIKAENELERIFSHEQEQEKYLDLILAKLVTDDR